jgi:hypothetical protein
MNNLKKKSNKVVFQYEQQCAINDAERLKQLQKPPHFKKSVLRLSSLISIWLAGMK